MAIGQNIAKKFGYIPRTDVAKMIKQQRQNHRSFEAVQINRLTKDFVEASASINADIRAGGVRLRNLSRQMYENSSYARRWVDLFVTNVVGPGGHILQSDIKIFEEDPDSKEVNEVSDDGKNNLIENLFAEWSKPQHCSVTQSHSYATMQKMMARHKARDGECFVRRVIDPASKFGLRLQIIPSEMVPENYTVDLNNGNVVICGIEYDAWRKPVAYYVRKNTPKRDMWGLASQEGELERIPASEMIHWFDPDFSNQGRGYTRMANVILMLTWLKDYNRASVLNAKFTARKLGFLSDVNPEDPAESFNSDSNENTPKENIQGETQSPKRPAISGEELTFTYIGNTKLEKWDPTYPHEQHEPFNRVTVRDIATGLNVAYCSLSGDYNNSTWSSSRTELDVERNGWRHEQELMIDAVDLRVFSWWLELALMMGAIPGFRYKDFDRLNKPYFFGPCWDYINPVDESNALRSDLEAQIISPYDVAAKKGRRLEDIYRDFASAARLRKKIGVPEPVYGKTVNQSTGLDPVVPPATNGKAKTNGVAA